MYTFSGYTIDDFVIKIFGLELIIANHNVCLG